MFDHPSMPRPAPHHAGSVLEPVSRTFTGNESYGSSSISTLGLLAGFAAGRGVHEHKAGVSRQAGVNSGAQEWLLQPWRVSRSQSSSPGLRSSRDWFFTRWVGSSSIAT